MNTKTREDVNAILKKMGITWEEWKVLSSTLLVTVDDYDNNSDTDTTSGNTTQDSVSTCIINTVVPSNTICLPKYSSISDWVWHILDEFKIRPRLKGYKYLHDAIILLYENSEPDFATMTFIYDKVSKKHNATCSKVERAMRYARTSSLKITPHDIIKKYVPYALRFNYVESISNFDFIAGIVKFMRVHINEEVISE